MRVLSQEWIFCSLLLFRMTHISISTSYALCWLVQTPPAGNSVGSCTLKFNRCDCQGLSWVARVPDGCCSSVVSYPSAVVHVIFLTVPIVADGSSREMAVWPTEPLFRQATSSFWIFHCPSVRWLFDTAPVFSMQPSIPFWFNPPFLVPSSHYSLTIHWFLSAIWRSIQNEITLVFPWGVPIVLIFAWTWDPWVYFWACQT